MLPRSTAKHPGSESQALDGPVQAWAGEYKLPARGFLQPVGWRDISDPFFGATLATGAGTPRAPLPTLSTYNRRESGYMPQRSSCGDHTPGAPSPAPLVGLGGERGEQSRVTGAHWPRPSKGQTCRQATSGGVGCLGNLGRPCLKTERKEKTGVRGAGSAYKSSPGTCLPSQVYSPQPTWYPLTSTLCSRMRAHNNNN